jgi:ribosomal-protein-alanine N-acetyltransferase
VARLTVEGAEGAAALEGTLPGLIEAWRESGVWLVSCRLPAAWSDERRMLEEAGFRAIETLITYARPLLRRPEPALPISPARAADAETCIEIGRTAFRFDRYHADPEIDNGGADALKAAWVRNALAGRADASLVVREDDAARGFVLCLLRGEEAVIDLIAVAPGHWGRGLGRALVVGALAHYDEAAHTMRVSTQVTNRASTALYEGLGFRELGRARTYHWINGEARR